MALIEIHHISNNLAYFECKNLSPKNIPLTCMFPVLTLDAQGLDRSAFGFS